MSKCYVKQFMPLWENCELGKKLGSGSFGDVWELIRYENGVRIVEAVKEVLVPPPSVKGFNGAKLQGLDKAGANYFFRKMLQRSIDEATLMQHLTNCKHIVQFKDWKVCEFDPSEEEIGWAIYIRMELLTALDEMMVQDGLTIPQVIQLGLDLCDAVEECHKKGILHRDIKPENVFYSSEHQCFKLGDFGISIHVSRPTEGKGLPGTLTYMCPEVYRGQRYSESSDLYAVSMVLYKILNDNRVPLLPPYPEFYLPNDRDQALSARLEGAEIGLPAVVLHEESKEHPTLRLDPKDMPMARKLAEVVTKAISPDPSKRYPKPKDLAEALRQVSISE